MLAVLIVLVLAAGVVTALVADPFSPPTRPSSPPRLVVLPRDAAPSMTRVEAVPDGRVVAVEQAPVTSVDGSPILRVRLRGLHPDAPWTAALRLQLEGHDEVAGGSREHVDEQVPDAAGRASFDLPAWAAGEISDCFLVAGDANYMSLQHRWRHGLDFVQELVLDVQVVTVLVGRVVDERGMPVPAARVCAFAQRGEGPRALMLGQCDCDRDGGYRLQANPGVPLLVVACPVTGRDGGRSADEPAGLLDAGELHGELLPATRRVTTSIGAVTTVDDLVLPAASPVTGVVQWYDGTPVPLASVRLLPAGGRSLSIGGPVVVNVGEDGAAIVGAAVDTDDDGAFALSACPGRAVQVAVVRLQDIELLVDWPSRQVVPPQPVTFSLPTPTRLRVTHAGKVVPRARIERDGAADLIAGANGVLTVVCATPVRVRAVHEQLCSGWVELGAHTVGAIVPIELAAPQRTEVSIEFEGQHRVARTRIGWRCEDGRTGGEQLSRGDGEGAFRLFLEPGRYRLTAGPVRGDRTDFCLLPVERELVVGGEPVELRLPATFGGRLVVHATDANGLFVAGSCRVLDSDDKDCSDRFVVELDAARGSQLGPVGQLMADGPNQLLRVLPAGQYRLAFAFDGRDELRRRVSIAPRDIAVVRLRLP